MRETLCPPAAPRAEENLAWLRERGAYYLVGRPKPKLRDSVERSRLRAASHRRGLDARDFIKLPRQIPVVA